MQNNLNIDPQMTHMSGLGQLAGEFLSRIAVPVTRKDIDWRSTAYQHYGWGTTNPQTGIEHTKQSSLMDALFQHAKKIIIVRASKRGGKTTALKTAARVMHREMPGCRGWIMSSTYALTDMIFSDLFLSAAGGDFGEVTTKSRKDRKVEISGGGLAQAKSWDDPDAIEGESLDYIFADEAQTLDEVRYNLMLARLLDRNGVLVMIGSPSSTDTWFLTKCEEAKLNPRWEYIEWTIKENPFLDQEQVSGLQADWSGEAFDELFMLKIRTPRGLVFSHEYDQQGSKFRAEPDPNYPMQVWIDPGTTAGAYAVLFVQVIMGAIPRIFVFDEYYEHFTYSEKVIHEIKQHRYWPLVSMGVMDVAGRQHHDKAASPKELWTTLTRLPIYDQRVEILPGIERVKTMLLNPATGLRRLLVHERCKFTHFEFLNYRYQESTNIMVNAKKKPIDAFNHSLKALSYGVIHNFGYKDKSASGPKGRILR